MKLSANELRTFRSGPVYSLNLNHVSHACVLYHCPQYKMLLICILVCGGLNKFSFLETTKHTQIHRVLEKGLKTKRRKRKTDR